MSLSSKLDKDYIEAYKAKETVKVAVLRLLRTAIKNRTKDLGRDLQDDETLDMIAKQVKQRKESIEQFTKAGRTDLAEKEILELDQLKAYMPDALSDEELVQAIAAAISQLSAKGMQDMGRVMQAVLSAHKGQVDGKKASDLVKLRLST